VAIIVVIDTIGYIRKQTTNYKIRRKLKHKDIFLNVNAFKFIIPPCFKNIPNNSFLFHKKSI